MNKPKYEHNFSGSVCMKCHYDSGEYPYKVTQPCTLGDRTAETLEELLKRYWGLMPPADRDFFKNPNAYNNRQQHPQPYHFTTVWLLDELQDFVDRKVAEASK